MNEKLSPGDFITAVIDLVNPEKVGKGVLILEGTVTHITDDLLHLDNGGTVAYNNTLVAIKKQENISSLDFEKRKRAMSNHPSNWKK